MPRRFNTQHDPHSCIPDLPSDNVVTLTPIAEDDFPPDNDIETAVSEAPSEPLAMPEPITLLDVMRHRAEAEKLEIETEWKSVVQKLATDSASEVEVSAVLRASGKPLSELESDVARLKEIHRLEIEVAAFRERVREHQRRHREHMALDTRKKIRDFIKQAEAEDRAKRSAAYMASRAVDRSRVAATQLGRLLGREILLPSIEPDAAPETMLADVLDEAMPDVAELAGAC